MSQNFIIHLFERSVYTILIVSAPMLGLGLLVGLIVSIFQATTQIQEQTLAFIPKIIAVLLAIVIFGPWMLSHLVEFTESIFNQIGKNLN
ncbi:MULTISPECIES: flagellar biosynthesis protein FliQ [Tepidibacillus]|uniref:Flagellar biosynthetic protein FliQ n=1 Tax=Tepidibacillus decaturensis TaxID=1413211 RepID=A0A135L375_9BACI|nr:MULTISPECIES: flagellar biosynthesis protein FliQ [Tepidibacillus]KXG43401.1 EscS/YscS/HrcS family type III secretion system export apparatus protein [Tepidibacillus decaturensis]GBF11615.1 flagellar biosynthetic protein FliQ [Tepidibacillus sp. HK-1]